MKTTWRLGSAVLSVVLASGVAVLAQSGSTNREEQSITVTGCLQAPGSNNGAVGTAGSTTAGAADASRAGSADSTTYILMNAKVGGAPGGGSGVTTVAPAGSGTTPSAVQSGNTRPSPALTGAIGPNGEPNGADSRTYVLSGHPELARHVGQEVQISGRVAGAAAAAATTGSASTTSGSSSTTAGSPSTTTSSSSTTTAPSTSGSAAARGAGNQQIEVQTIRMIASVCAAK